MKGMIEAVAAKIRTLALPHEHLPDCHGWREDSELIAKAAIEAARPYIIAEYNQGLLDAIFEAAAQEKAAIQKANEHD